MAVRPLSPGEPPRHIPDPGFSGDDGGVAAPLAAALANYSASYAADPSTFHAALGLLQHERVLVPVVALLGEVEYDEDGLAHDKTSDMASVLLTASDGRKGLLAFTCMESLHAWNPDARPVPVPLKTAALSAIQDEADALIVDVAGPVPFVVDGDTLRYLAEGLTLIRHDGGWAWAQVSDA